MAQKINPTSARLGKKLFWTSLFQNYGKKLFKYSNYHFVIWFSLFLVKSLQKNIILTSSLTFLSSATTLVFISPTLKAFEKIQVKRFHKNLVERQSWWSSPTTVLLFLNSSSVKSAQFITSYFHFLITGNFFFRKALTVIIMLLEQQIGHKKLIMSSSGFKKIVLKGFRIAVTGRFENSKTQMSKKLYHKSGSLSLLSLNSFVEYSSVVINSPLGVYNLKVWLFYR